MLSNVKQISGLYSTCIFFYCVLQLLSAAEDSLVRVWHLTMTPETNTVEVTVPRTQYKAYFCCWFTLNTHLMTVSPTFNFHHVVFFPYSTLFFQSPFRLHICTTSVWQTHKSAAPSSATATVMPSQWQATTWVRLSATRRHRCAPQVRWSV